MLCEYGCGREAKYFFKRVKKWCCSTHTSRCPKIARNHSTCLKGKKSKTSFEYFGLELCSYGCGQIAKFRMNNGKLCCSKNHGGCPKVKEKNKTSNLGKVSPMLNKNHTKESNEKNRISHLNKKLTQEHIEKVIASLTGNNRSLEYWTRKYPFFSKIEEMRYNPENPKKREIQVHCKNSNCINSKEKSGWFIPTYIQFSARINALEKEDGNDGSYFYCSQYCKDTCPLYNINPANELKKQENNHKELPYTPAQRQAWNDQVLKQDNYECQKCGSKENLHCHHIRPVKLEPELSLDPENGIILCQTCHDKYGHKKGTECSKGNLANTVCKKKKKGNN